MNSLFSQLNGNNQSNFNILNLLKSGANPMQLLSTLASSNPQAKELLNEIASSNGDYKSLFYSKAKQMGKDPQEILNKLK